IYVFLSGGLAQHDSFDLKPDAPAEIRGEFEPIDTKTAGIRIVEHLPRLAQRSRTWALVRSLTHKSNAHSDGHLFMLTGRSTLPAGYSPNKASPTDWPSVASVAGAATRPRNNLPPAVVLPDRIVHNSGRTIPGQFGGVMGRHRDPWFIEASPFEPRAYGAFPEYEFDHQERPMPQKKRVFQAPSLSMPEGVLNDRFSKRLDLLSRIDSQRKQLNRGGDSGRFGSFHQGAISLLTQKRVRDAFDVTRS